MSDEPENNSKAKAWEALRNAAVQAIENDALDTPEGRSALANLLIQPLVPKWGKAPDDARCTKCGAAELERSFILAGSSFSGSVRCPTCGYHESVMSQIGKTCFSVEPMDPKPGT